jgi:hypothetical protein
MNRLWNVTSTAKGDSAPYDVTGQIPYVLAEDSVGTNMQVPPLTN